MNEKLLQRVRRYLSDHKKKKYFMISMGTLSICTVFFVYGFLVQPAISLEKKQIIIESEQTEGEYTDTLTVNVTASAQDGQTETYFMISAKELGAALSEAYAFDGDVELIDIGEEKKLEFNRIEKSKGTNYWFVLQEGETASFSLDCVVTDTNILKEKEPEQEETVQEETVQETTNAVLESDPEAPETESANADEETVEAETVEETIVEATTVEETAAEETATEETATEETTAEETIAEETKAEESVSEDIESEEDDIELKPRDKKKYLTFYYTYAETLEECKANLQKKRLTEDAQVRFDQLVLTWMSRSDFEKLSQMDIEVQADEVTAETGHKILVNVSASVETEASRKKIFTLQLSGDNAGLSKDYKFRSGTVKIKDEYGERIVLHRLDKPVEGGTVYWFALKPGEETYFQLKCIDGVGKAATESDAMASVSEASPSEIPEEEVIADETGDVESNLKIYAGAGINPKEACANGRNRQPLSLFWETAGTVTLQKVLPDGMTVTLTAPKDAFDGEEALSLSVRELTGEETQIARELIEKDAQAKNEAVDSLRLWDIKILSGDQEIQPSETVTVTFGNVNNLQENTKVMHVDEAEESVEDMNAITEEDGKVVMETNHFSTYGFVSVAAAQGPVKNISVEEVQWNKETKKLESVKIKTKGAKDYYYTMQYSDGNDEWIPCSDELGKITDDGAEIGLSIASEGLEQSTAKGSQNRQFRTEFYKKNNKGVKNNIGQSDSIYVKDSLDMVKNGFSKWIDEGVYMEFGIATPESLDGLYSSFALYSELPEISLIQGVVPEDITSVRLKVLVKPESSGAAYRWQYWSVGKSEWILWPESPDSDSIDLTTQEYKDFVKANPRIRCRVENATGTLIGFSNEVTVNLQNALQGIVDKINTELGLAKYPIGSSKTADLSIGGKQFKDYFYYDNVAADPNVDFKDAETYTEYLVKLYSEEGIEAVRDAWEYHLYDLYDPNYDLGSMSNIGTTYPNPGGYGDKKFAWPKDSDKTNSSPFHGKVSPAIKPLNYDFLEDGVDYSNFITGLNKTAVGKASGDANTERRYDIRITADAQAKAVAPVAMIFQIQTSWQMFDMDHANKQKPGSGEENDGTAIGGCAFNTELGNLYDIKRALLRLVEYVNEKYPGNNMVLGITDVEHAGTFSMFNGSDSNRKTLYVTNDFEQLKAGIIGWDSFGNCEHVHYGSTALTSAVANLSSNLSGWRDMYGSEIKYGDIQKVAVIIGGPTENSNGTSGYKIPLPWSDFQDSQLNSVYGIRTNEGTPVSGNLGNIISWIDYSENNKGTPYKDGNGTCFTNKYVATNEDMIFETLKNIAEKEMRTKGLDITNTDATVDDVTVEDTIQKEFMLDETAEIKATILNKDGSVNSSKVISLKDAVVATDPEGNQITKTADGSLTITRYTDLTTTLVYNFGTVHNTKKAVLDFTVVARENYIGSNNVFTNVGTPELTYQHEKNNQTTVYEVHSPDKPEVNVPIRFDTVDGERTTILKGDTVNLKTLSDRIVEDAEYRAELYSQINGTLTYRWQLPDGKSQEAFVTIEDGKIISAEFPNRGYDFYGASPGAYMGTLHVVFSPEQTDDPGRLAVKPLDKPGNVWIDVVDGNSQVKLNVEKRWKDGTPDNIDRVTFKILEVMPDGTSHAVKDSSEKERIFELTRENDWKTVIEGLPASKDGKVITYKVEETPVPEGYQVTYSMDEQSETLYGARATVNFTYTGGDKSNKNCTITYTYGGKSYSFSVNGTYKKNGYYSLEDAEHLLELDEDGGIKPGVITMISVDGDKHYLNASISFTTEVAGTTSTPIYVITNEKTVELPETGGSGTLPYTMAGCFLMGSVGLLYRKKKRGGEAENTF